MNAKALSLFFTVALVAGVAAACGPWFPNRMLFGSDEELLSAPVADFHRELARICPPAPTPFRAKPSGNRGRHQQTIDAGAADLQAALAEAGTPPADRRRILADYHRLRERMIELAGKNAGRRETGDEPAPEPPAMTVPAGLPGEFADYLRGAIAYRQGRMNPARAAWSALLARPRAQRKYRTTWAAFMIGKSCLARYPDTAIPWFRRVRTAAAVGYADSLGLAAASFGWEARTYLNGERYGKAIELYLAQHATGDETAAISLLWTASRALSAGPEALKALAGKVRVRRVITAYLLSKGGPRVHGIVPRPDNRCVTVWLAALGAAGAADVTEAGRLAWTAYQGGQFDAAWRWLRLAPAKSPIAQWTRAKLLLRAGEIDEASAALAKAAKGFPPAETWDTFCRGRHEPSFHPAEQVGGELALLCLSRRQYSRALDLLLRADFWEDAAFVAERVLTPNELVAYVDRTFPAAMSEAYRPDEKGFDAPPGEEANRWALDIRYLLARRLTRIGRWKQARPYYPAVMRGVLDEYIAAIRAGHDKRRSTSERAESFWSAAKIARHQGMELLGTEVGPDAHTRDGCFPMASTTGMMDSRRETKLAPPSDDELGRIAAHRVDPEKRFHYRYTAAEHAWQAAALLPDNSDRTAQILCTAGTWLKNRDPDAADRFYKALVLRCRGTELGRRADEVRWFPKLDLAEGE